MHLGPLLVCLSKYLQFLYAISAGMKRYFHAIPTFYRKSTLFDIVQLWVSVLDALISFKKPGRYACIFGQCEFLPRKNPWPTSNRDVVPTKPHVLPSAQGGTHRRLRPQCLSPSASRRDLRPCAFHGGTKTGYCFGYCRLLGGCSLRM